MVFLVLFCSMFEMLISLVYFLFNLGTVFPRMWSKSKRMKAELSTEAENPILVHLLDEEKGEAPRLSTSEHPNHVPYTTHFAPGTRGGGRLKTTTTSPTSEHV